jgi:hypothetical protein
MLQTWVHRIKPGYEGRLHEWFEQLHARAGEVRESFSTSGVRAEQAFILPGGVLVYVSEVADAGHAARAFDESSLAIDVEHRRVMEECIEGGVDVTPAYDMTI